MHRIGLDVHKKQTVLCVVDAQGAVVGRGKVASDEQGWVGLLQRWATGPEGARVAIEAGASCFWMVSAAREQGVEPVVVDVRRFRVIGHSTRESDRRDAFELVDALRTRTAEKCAVVIPVTALPACRDP